MPATSETFEDIARRVRAEYCEMPGLMLTVRQAARMWSLEQSVSESILESLAETGFLSVGENGAYMLDGRERSERFFHD